MAAMPTPERTTKASDVRQDSTRTRLPGGGNPGGIDGIPGTHTAEAPGSVAVAKFCHFGQ